MRAPPYRRPREARFAFDVDLGRWTEREALRAERGLTLVQFLLIVSVATALAGIVTRLGLWFVVPLPALFAILLWRSQRQQGVPGSLAARGFLDESGLFVEQDTGQSAQYRWDAIRGARTTPRALVIWLTCGTEVVIPRPSTSEANEIVAFIDAHAGARAQPSRDRTFTALATSYVGLAAAASAIVLARPTSPMEPEETTTSWESVERVAGALEEGRAPDPSTVDALLRTPCGRGRLLQVLGAYERLDLAPGDPVSVRAEVAIEDAGPFCSLRPLGALRIEDPELGAVEYLAFETERFAHDEMGFAVAGPYAGAGQLALPEPHATVDAGAWTAETLAREAGALHWRAFARAGNDEPVFVRNGAPSDP